MKQTTIAACTEFTCNHCGFKIEAWDDGNPYLTDHDGKRHFFYHPGGEREMREFYVRQMMEPEIEESLVKAMAEHLVPAEFDAFLKARSGNEGAFLCMQCGRQTRRDPQRDAMRCTGCGKLKLRDTCKLEGCTCPKCGKGTFAGDSMAIS